VLGSLQGDGETGQDVGDHVDDQNLSCRHRCWHACGSRADDEAELAEIAAEQQAERTADVMPEATALHESLDERGEVVIGEHHVRGLAGYLGAAAPHRDAYVSQAQRGRVVDTVARHGNGVAAVLEAFDDAHLVERGGACDDDGTLERGFERAVV
jgi:hypothetical protein